MVADAGVAVSSVDWFIPHQANQRILQGVAHRLGIDENRVVYTVALHANTSAASIPLALDYAVRTGRAKQRRQHRWVRVDPDAERSEPAGPVHQSISKGVHQGWFTRQRTLTTARESLSRSASAA